MSRRWLGQATGFAVVLAAMALVGCQREDSNAAAQVSSSRAMVEVVLAGDFVRVAKAVEGRAEIVRRGQSYQLRLRNVRVDHLAEVHVYLVGLPDVRSTIELMATETKYDFGPLEQGAEQQVIDLPSEPAPELRSVVLYEPRYRINLAAASLTP